MISHTWRSSCQQAKPRNNRILIEKEGSDKKIELAALWSTSKQDVFSVRGKLGYQEIKGIMVRNVPKAKASERSSPSQESRTTTKKPSP